MHELEDCVVWGPIMAVSLVYPSSSATMLIILAPCVQGVPQPSII